MEYRANRPRSPRQSAATWRAGGVWRLDLAAADLPGAAGGGAVRPGPAGGPAGDGGVRGSSCAADLRAGARAAIAHARGDLRRAGGRALALADLHEPDRAAGRAG